MIKKDHFHWEDITKQIEIDRTTLWRKLKMYKSENTETKCFKTFLYETE